MKNLQQLETEIRRALTSSAFAQAETLFTRYVVAVEQHLRTLTPGSEAVRALELRARRMFDWSLTMARVNRELSTNEMTRLQLVSCYGASPQYSQISTQA